MIPPVNPKNPADLGTFAEYMQNEGVKIPKKPKQPIAKDTEEKLRLERLADERKAALKDGAIITNENNKGFDAIYISKNAQSAEKYRALGESIEKMIQTIDINQVSKYPDLKHTLHIIEKAQKDKKTLMYSPQLKEEFLDAIGGGMDFGIKRVKDYYNSNLYVGMLKGELKKKIAGDILVHTYLQDIKMLESIHPNQSDVAIETSPPVKISEHDAEKNILKSQYFKETQNYFDVVRQKVGKMYELNQKDSTADMSEKQQVVNTDQPQKLSSIDITV